MGDVLPPKRQTVVDRLRRRIELYRRHHNACLPRYEQSANGLYEQQRQDTILLKQRYLEAKAKKAKRSDHRTSAKESNSDAQKLISQPRPLKGLSDSSPATLTPDAVTEDSELITKVARTECSTPEQTIHDQSSLPSFSVQIVQQFTNSNPSQAQNSQTIQTNVTVKTLSGSVNTSNSPLAVTSKGQKENQQLQQQSQVQQPQQQQTTPVSSVSNTECKQEKESEDSDLCLCRTQGSTGGRDRLSDTFPSIGFAEDSSDDVIHPDILKDLIDDVFTNSADIMKDFNFEDSVSSVKDQDGSEKDSDSNLLDLVKVSSPSQFQPFQSETAGFDSSQSSQSQSEGLGLFSSTSVSNPTTMVAITTTTPSTSTSSSLYPQSTQLPAYNNHSGGSLSISSGLGLDFKLTEPSPAALTLKQMAEQHQNMQQKQQHMSLGISSPHSNTNGRGQYSQDSFTDSISSIRSNYNMNGPGSKMTPISKGPNSAGMFNSVGYDPMNSYPGIRLFGNSSFKQELCMGGMGGHLPEPEMQQKQNFHIRQIPSSHPNGPSPNHDPPAYCATRPLTHYPDQLNQNNLSHTLPIQYKPTMQPELRIPMNQSQQQMHISQTSQQLQRQVQPTSPDLKNQQQIPMVQSHSNIYGTYPKQTANNSMFHVAMQQSMSYTSRFGPNSVVSRPPPDYKVHPPNMPPVGMPMVEQHDPTAHIMYHSAATKNTFSPQNVSMNQETLSLGHRTCGDWRHNTVHEQQGVVRMDSYNNNQEEYNIMGSEGSYSSGMPRVAMHHQYRMMMNSGKIPRSQIVNSNHSMMSQRQQMSMHGSPLNHHLPPGAMELQSRPSLQIAANGLQQVNATGISCGNPDMSRQDGHHINLDFLDNIESSASDFLNFDQVIQSSGAHFQLLDEMEMLSK